MDIIYSVHAEEQLAERKIDKVWVEETIKSPDRYEIIGALVALLGVLIIFYAPR